MAYSKFIETFIWFKVYYVLFMILVGLICHQSRTRSFVMFHVKINIGDPMNIESVSRILRVFYRQFFGLRVNVTGSDEGRDLLLGPNKKPFIVAANHQSGIDFITMNEVHPLNCTALVKKSLMYTTGPFGILGYVCGVQFISRGDYKAVKSRMAKITKNIREKGWRIWIFPEGSRNVDGGMMSFKIGAFRLAVEADVPIIPVVISNLNGIFNYNEKYWVPGELEVRILDPIQPNECGSDAAILAEETRKRMMDVFNTLKTNPDL
ncbi:hypothetical protein ACOME3_006184 [Neoechinorhynchus agilis]